MKDFFDFDFVLKFMFELWLVLKKGDIFCVLVWGGVIVIVGGGFGDSMCMVVDFGQWVMSDLKVVFGDYELCGLLLVIEEVQVLKEVFFDLFGFCFVEKIIVMVIMNLFWQYFQYVQIEMVIVDCVQVVFVGQQNVKDVMVQVGDEVQKLLG